MASLRHAAARRSAFASLLIAAGMLLFPAGCRRSDTPPAVPSRQTPAASREVQQRSQIHLADNATKSPSAATEIGSSQTEPDDDDASLAEIQWPPKFQRSRLRASIKSAIDYLVRTTDDEGKFAYIVNTDPDVPQTDEYNVVRHAGTMYGLGMYLDRYDEDADKVRAALLRQGRFLRQQMQAVPEHAEMLAIWSDPSVTGLEGPRRAELGSAALGLVGLCSLERQVPGSVPAEELTHLANFILFMQRADGGFDARYVPEQGGKQFVPKLLFYPGEAALSLVLLYEVDSNPRWLEAAAQAIAFLSRQRDAAGRPPLDHWMLLATARIWPHYDKTSKPVSRAHLERYSIDLCRRLMETSPPQVDDRRLKGCITGTGLTCPTATRAEGLVAALDYLPRRRAAFRAKVRRVAEDALLFLMNSQVAQGKYRGGIPFAMFRFPEDHPLQARWNYNRMAGEIRIDYVHHAISGMMLYDDVVLRGK